MKQITVLLAALIVCLMPVLLMAQDDCSNTQDCKKVIIVKNSSDVKGLENLEGLKDLDELKKMKIEITTAQDMNESDAPDAPFFGIYPAELDFPKAQALNYPYSYGILVTGIVPNSPAYQYRLVEDDIIMEIGGKKAINLSEFNKLKDAYRAGDAVVLTIFRSGEEKRIDFVFGARPRKELSISEGSTDKKEAKKLSPGYGGGTWIPMWYQADMEDVNDLVSSFGIDALSDDGVLSQGIGGKGNIGKGWFIGGQYNWYNTSKKADDASNPGFTNYVDYNMSFGGVTLDKRIPITKGIITSLGVMLGGGSHTVELLHTNGDYNWPGTGSVMGSNTYAKMNRGYLLVQPRAEIMVRVLSWLAIRGEAGYLYGYAPQKGWTVKHMESDSYQMSNSPDTPFQGMTFTVGPWFGF